MYLEEELAQPVGNAKIRGEFDTDAATAGDQNTNGAGLFQRLDAALAREDALSLLTQGIAQLLPALETRKHSVALPDTNDVIRRFNRDTKSVFKNRMSRDRTGLRPRPAAETGRGSAPELHHNDH